MMKLALLEVPPWTFRSLCLMVGGGALLILARAAGTPMSVPRRLLPALALVALFNITGWHLFSAYALLHTGSGRAAIIGYTMPLWASLLSIWVLDVRPTARQVAALLLGMAALALLMVKDFGALGAAPTGALLMLGAALCWAIGTVLVKKFAWDGLAVTALTALAAADRRPADRDRLVAARAGARPRARSACPPRSASPMPCSSP